LGTATTIDVVSAGREFLGGIIAPGLEAMGEALHLKSAEVAEDHGCEGGEAARDIDRRVDPVRYL
jgi:pantothenate kinase type III